MVKLRMREQLQRTRMQRSSAGGIVILRVAGLALLVSATLGWASTTREPDGGGCAATDSAVYSFNDISSGGSGTGVLPGEDNGSVQITLAFPFQCDGQD